MFKRTALALAATFVLGSASAGVVWNTGPEIGIANYATYRLLADDFSFSKATTVTGAELSVIGINNFSRWDGTVEYYIFTDNAGRPGTAALHGKGQNISITEGGFYWPGLGTSKRLSFDFESSLSALASTTYWLGIHLQKDYEVSFNDSGYLNALWMYSSYDVGNAATAHLGDQSAWADYVPTGTFSFSLRDNEISAVPEPSPVTLIGAGLAGLLWMRRRKDTREQA
ncbi:PEP-CTERM sorting domain-containing protein [Pseudorhodoferax sp. LjRoot39]|uniref:PEP-CTERM sorting domain-containing protein n=1 Tax=Pseudorhodoferax sp. LjRoot39 TaxID=3342328 RepID=UPI003ECEDC7B